MDTFLLQDSPSKLHREGSGGGDPGPCHTQCNNHDAASIMAPSWNTTCPLKQNKKKHKNQQQQQQQQEEPPRA